ncbi:heparinase II/III domain-containing protein [Alteromonas stellipolaris]|uniref:Heparinase II/III family protein n=1 Tax=Alteromonas stellipolaris TaxID=233316 RepID=A0AAW7Z7P4_9ALTE|nr:heparinase II/III family protein [Alteromonas stellipolaris]MDO6578821.1 heparinase II/III family protein [Alteromonas stellipolaris]MDP2536451.1 heparinase II/III family protein [Alteromonas stellipolaris]
MTVTTQNNSLKNVFENVNDEQISFFLRENAGKNQEAKYNLFAAINESTVKTNSFEDVNIDFRTFDWTSSGQDRNWWWQVQALPFLGWFVACRGLLSVKERSLAAQFCKDSLVNWIEIIPEDDDKTLRWHDHATSYRLTNLFNWLFCLWLDDDLNEFGQELDCPYSMEGILKRHISWLSEDENYSKHTNHGFDQATVVFIIALYTNYPNWKSFFELAEDRLIEEIEFAYTEEGVHKENSPGYHIFMLRRLTRFSKLGDLHTNKVSDRAMLLEERATDFKEALTLADGTLPLVGDTRGGHFVEKYDYPSELTVYDYSESGYVIVKGNVLDKPLYLMVKNCFDSVYHRHDDDLHIYLSYDDIDLLSDGGLGAHNEKDPRRITLRSNECHNVPYIFGKKAIRNRKTLVGDPTLHVSEGFIVAESFLYGQKITRTVDISHLASGSIEITDVIDGEEKGMMENLFFHQFANVSLENNQAIISVDEQKRMTIAFGSENIRAETKDRPFSKQYGVYESAPSLIIDASEQSRHSFRVRLF